MRILKFMVYGLTQTYTRILQCSPASVGLTQARPNYYMYCLCLAISIRLVFSSWCHDLWYHLLYRGFQESALAAVWACVSDSDWWSPWVCGQSLLWGTLPFLPSWLCQECAPVLPQATKVWEPGVQGRWWLRVMRYKVCLIHQTNEENRLRNLKWELGLKTQALDQLL